MRPSLRNKTASTEQDTQCPPLSSGPSSAGDHAHTHKYTRFGSVFSQFIIIFSSVFIFFQVILYSADRICDDFYPDLKGRVHFTSNDIRSGDASVNITSIQLSDAGTYQCRVKQSLGVANRNIQLAVTGKFLWLVTGVLETGWALIALKSQRFIRQSFDSRVIIRLSFAMLGVKPRAHAC